jgi:hypothetical protein
MEKIRLLKIFNSSKSIIPTSNIPIGVKPLSSGDEETD